MQKIIEIEQHLLFFIDFFTRAKILRPTSSSARSTVNEK